MNNLCINEMTMSFDHSHMALIQVQMKKPIQIQTRCLFIFIFAANIFRVKYTISTPLRIENPEKSKLPRFQIDRSIDGYLNHQQYMNGRKVTSVVLIWLLFRFNTSKHSQGKTIRHWSPYVIFDSKGNLIGLRVNLRKVPSCPQSQISESPSCF